MAAAGPPPLPLALADLRGIPVRLDYADGAYAGRIDTAAHESMIAEARLHVARTRAAYDRLVARIGYVPTKPEEASRPADWIDAYSCPHAQERLVDCCAEQFDIAAGDWRWGRDGRRALASRARLSVGTFPATRSIFIKAIANANATLQAFHVYRRNTDYRSVVYKEFVRRAFITLRAAEVLCTRFVHLQAVLPVPRPAAELVWMPRMMRCAFGYVHVISNVQVAFSRCGFVAPVMKLCHGGKHACARHADVPAGWISFSGSDPHRASLMDMKNPRYITANRLCAAKRRRARLERGTKYVERRRKLARRGMAARGLNDTRLVEYIIALAEMRPA